MAEAVLIAETDRRTLVHLPRVLSESLPNVQVDLCTSTEDLARKLKQSAYDTLVMTPMFFQEYGLIKQTKPFQLLAPLIVTASAQQRPLVQAALETTAFDLIVKPIQEHMRAFPYTLQAEAHFISKMAAYERTFEAIRSSMRLLANVNDDQALFNMAADVVEITRQQALDRLDMLSPDGLSQ